MITKSLWNNFNTIKHYTINPCVFISYTPSELAIVFIIYSITTPFLMVLDLTLIPIEILYYNLKRHYEKKLEKENKNATI